MSSSNNIKASSTPTAVEPLLTAMVLAVGAGPVLEEGPKGEAALAVQIAALLHENMPLACEELDLLYRYQHGVGIRQALQMAGVGGTLQEFVKAQKECSLLKLNSEGCIMKASATPESTEDAEAITEDCKETSADTMSTADTEDGADSDSHPDAEAWYDLGGRMACALDDLSDSDGEAEEEPAPDVEAWRQVGVRVLKTFRELQDDDEEEPLPKGIETSWQSVGIRLAHKLSDDEL